MSNNEVKIVDIATVNQSFGQAVIKKFAESFGRAVIKKFAEEITEKYRGKKKKGITSMFSSLNNIDKRLAICNCPHKYH